MEINELLTRSELITEKIFFYLNARSLAYFGACCTQWRSLSNQNIFWHRLCQLHGYLKYDYLLDTDSHPAIPLKTTTTSPVFSTREFGTILDPQCKWRKIFDRSEHLIKNWKSGIYFVAPVIKAHKGRISAFDSNRSVIVSGSSDDKLIKIWSIHDLELLNCFKSKTDSINCLKIFEEYIVIGGDDGNLKLFDLVNGDLQHTFSYSSNPEQGVEKFIIHDQKIIAVYSDRSIQIWCLKNRKLLSILRGHSDEIECLTCYKDILVSGGWDNLITIWDLKHGSKLTDLIGHQEVVNCVKIKDFSCLISASGDSTIKIWNFSISTGPKSQDRLMFNQVNFIDLKGHSSDVYSVDFYGDFIASTGADSLVIIWNFSGDLLHKLKGHLGIVRFCYMDEYKLITGGDAKRIVIWDYKNGKLLNTLHRNPNKINFMSLDDTKIMTASPDIESNITLICYW